MYKTIFLSTVLSSGIAAAVLWVARKWLVAQAQYSFDKRLEVLKAQLTQSREQDLATIRSGFDKQLAMQSEAYGTFARGQEAVQERRLQAIERLWGATLKMREVPSVAMQLSDQHPNDEQNDLRNILNPVDTKMDLKIISPSVEEGRPYFGEYAWGLFFIYYNIIVRIGQMTKQYAELENKDLWHDDTQIRTLLKFLFSDSEYADYEKLPVGKIKLVRRTFETRILQAIDDVLVGRKLNDDLAEQAKNMIEQVGFTKIEA